MDRFKDQVAIVTGGASGIGQALCEELGRLGAVVVVADINTGGAKRVAESITASGGRARAAHLDVTDAEKVQRLVAETAAEHGRLDYMFNNAGIATLGEVRDTNMEHWQRLIDINLWGVIYGTTAAYNLMVEQKSGHIINTASQAGLYLIPGTTVYATAKHGVVGLSTSLRAEAAALGVKVSVVCPGPVKTNIFNAATMVRADRDEYFAQMPESMMVPATKAARIILRGVARNRAIIVFPFLARLLWWFFRLHPSLLNPMGSYGFSSFRKKFRRED